MYINFTCFCRKESRAKGNTYNIREADSGNIKKEEKK